MSKHLYHYGLIRTSDMSPNLMASIDDTALGPVTHVPYGAITAIVSETEETKIRSTRRNLMSHTRVLETMMLHAPSLPFRFGMITTEADDLSTMFQHQQDKLLGQLDDLEGFFEVGVRVSLQREVALNHITEHRSDIREARDAVLQKPTSEQHIHGMEVGRAVHDAMMSFRSEQADRFSAALSNIARDEVFMDVHEDIAVLNAAFLANKQQADDLLNILEEMDTESPELYQIKYLSPVPPFNFVSIDLSQDQSEAA